MKKYFILITALFTLFKCSAQQINIPDILPPPSISVNNLRVEECPIKIAEINIDVKVVGPMAITTLDLLFYNPNDRILEGEFTFPLNDGQNISRFALDIDGKLREGVVVNKAKGQEAFESVIRQNIDPGLLEKTQGNNFRARIYPLPAKGTRRIIIAYEQELKKENNDYIVFLPTEYNDTLDIFNIRLEVVGNDVAPKVNKSPWGEFSFDKSNEAFIASYNTKNYNAKGQLVFSVPNKNNEQVFIEKGKISNEIVFFSQIYPKLITQTKQKPSSIALFWDASLSMKDRNLDIELELLEKYLNKLNDTKIELYPFNCVLLPQKTFSIKNGNSKDLIKYLRELPNDGATQLGQLDFESTMANEILLFTDGLSNFGKQLPKIGNVPINIISSSQKADHSLLKYLTIKSGGNYINFSQIKINEALNLISTNSYRLISADYKKSEIKDFTTTRGSINEETGISIAGKLVSNKATIILNYGIGDKVINSESITINSNAIKDYDNLVEKIWAEKRIDELDLLYEQNKDEIEQLGRLYNIVTRNTSLIVLDRIEDYLRFEITPPSELLDEYEELRIDKEQDKKNARKEQIDHALSLLEKRKLWWNKEFPKNKTKHQSSKPAPLLSHSVQLIPPEVAEDNSVFDVLEYAVSMKDESDEIDMNNTYNQMQISDEIDMNNTYNQPQINPNQKVSIELKEWNPTTPYLEILKVKSNKDLYDTYLDIRDEYIASPSFFLEVATLFEERGLKLEALIILSNLAELDIENYRMRRVLGHRLLQLNYTNYAINQFEVVKRLRPEEPQSYRDLASALKQNKQYQESLNMLYKIIEKPWDGRFNQIEIIAIEEMNSVIYNATINNVELDLSDIDKQFIYNMPVDIRIVLNWDTDNSDMDLWVTDPYGEKCSFENTLTRIGGMISQDFTSGYGPEEFLIKEAVNGKYLIQANYFNTGEQTLLGPTTIYLDIYTNYADKKETKKTITLRLTENKEIIDIGEIIFSDK